MSNDIMNMVVCFYAVRVVLRVSQPVESQGLEHSPCMSFYDLHTVLYEFPCCIPQSALARNLCRFGPLCGEHPVAP